MYVAYAYASSVPTSHIVRPRLEEVFVGGVAPLRNIFYPLFTLDLPQLDPRASGPVHILYHEWFDRNGHDFHCAPDGRYLSPKLDHAEEIEGGVEEVEEGFERSVPCRWLRVVVVDVDIEPDETEDDSNFNKGHQAWMTRFFAAIDEAQPEGEPLFTLLGAPTWPRFPEPLCPNFIGQIRGASLGLCDSQYYWSWAFPGRFSCVTSS